MKKISIVTSCYNEEDNIPMLYEQITKTMERLSDRYCYEIIVADNASTDNTPQILRALASKDPNFKVIFNARNFGPDRSGYNAAMQAFGDAVVTIASDLQNPPAMINDFIIKWEQGYKVVMAIKTSSKESFFIFFLRTLYYKSLDRLSEVELISHFTGFGLYDRKVIEILRDLKDPYPYFRGLIADIGFEPAIIEFAQPARRHGKSKSSFLYLYEEAMLGITSYTKIPLRLATFLGFPAAMISFLVGMFYLVYKLVFWSRFTLGLAPIAIGLFFFSSVQLVFLGIIGEYIAMIYIHVLNRPLVYEKERLNF
ncbi:MAG TPA: glycosyltransferase family 2 protein [Anaerolineales bacterium]|nr:glycosyltransferase family 2 protein [Anaerolineales bacterium]